MIRVRQVKVNIDDDNLKKSIAKKLNIKEKEIIKYEIKKKSLDARKNHKLSFVYEFNVLINNEEKYLLNNKNQDIFKSPIEEYKFQVKGDKKINNEISIIGAGPAGLFCAYVLAENGYKPVIYERGEKIEDRINTVNDFWNKGILNEESNVQFGEGGAGTFSDGKLNTLVKDKYCRMKKVFEIFVECGAPKEILYENKPHIGTDNLRKVIINMRNKIISMGGKINYNSKLNDIIIKNNKIEEIVVHNKKIKCDALILAIGHSARDTFELLYKKNIDMESKPFAIGIRIMHPQKLIDEAQYNMVNEKLKKASYKLTYNTSSNRGVYSFCMCPGGFVVNASSRKNGIVTNGMSNYKRDEKNANSAIIVTVNQNDFGVKPLDGLKYMEHIEEKAYKATNGTLPLQKYIDFKNNIVSEKIGNIEPIIKGNWIFSNINEILPEYICKSLIEGIENFDKKIKGFASDDALIVAPETRTSSPIRLIRNENLQSNISGIYPCGEGSGYAGGITTSAMDGIKVAEEIAKIYSNVL